METRDAPARSRSERLWGHPGLRPLTHLGPSPAADGAGSVLTSAPLGAEFTARYQAPYVVIHRSDLLTILFEAYRDAGVDLVSDCAVTDVTVHPGHVEVATSAGPQRAAAAVAADGLRSALRGKFSHDEPICSGYVAYRGAFPVGQLDRQLESGQLEEVVVYIGPGRHLVQYPLRRGESFNTVAVFASPAYRRGEAEWGGPQELDEAFGGSCEAVVRGPRSLWRDRHWPMFDRLPMDRWVDGRLALTGDAAHPMLQYLAQGAWTISISRLAGYGPLLVPGRSGGLSPPADATLTVQPAAAVADGGILAITLYFAHAGAVALRLPVTERA